MEYKVLKIRDLHDLNPIIDFEKILNDEAKNGWKLHSLVPQVDNGAVFNNLAILIKE